ncbi:MAG: peptidase, partial [Notoacmeibacter sp.]
TFALFALGGVGGGDAKLLSAIAVWCGFSSVLVDYMLVAALMGGYLTISLILWRGTYFSEMAGAKFAFMERLGRNEVGVPYGIALGFAGLFTAPSMPLIKWAMESVAV